jgi:hypothetical protein
MEANKATSILVLNTLEKLFILFDTVLLNFELNYTLNTNTRNHDTIMQAVRHLENKGEIIKLISIIKASSGTLDYKGVLRRIIYILQQYNSELNYICNFNFTKRTNSSVVSRELQVELKKYLVAFSKIMLDLHTIIRGEQLSDELGEQISSIFAAENARLRMIEAQEERKKEENARVARQQAEQKAKESRNRQVKGREGLLGLFSQRPAAASASAAPAATNPERQGGKRNKKTIKRSKRLTKLNRDRAPKKAYRV